MVYGLCIRLGYRLILKFASHIQVYKDNLWKRNAAPDKTIIHSYKLFISNFDSQINVYISVVCRNFKTVIGFCIQYRRFEAPKWSTNYHYFVPMILSRMLKWFIPFTSDQCPYRCKLYWLNFILRTLIIPVCYRNHICSSIAWYLLQSRRNPISLSEVEVTDRRQKPTTERKMWLSYKKVVLDATELPYYIYERDWPITS